jgi:glycosyltransferase involved in cell wall biosynthesis
MPEDDLSKKVLIITYYWPPSGGSGVQRWLKFVKYLPQFGWQPYVFTPENPSFDIKDESLLKDVPPEAEVLHFPIWEPYALFNKLSGEKSGNMNANSAPKADSLFKKISIWIRGNIFIPDPRVFWVRPSVSFLDDFLRENKIRTIITTGPPHSLHLIGLRLKKKNPSLKWIADFRDPWSEWGFLDTIKVGALARNIHKRLERKVLQTADRVTAITPFYVRHFQRLGDRPVTLLTNGYDTEDFEGFALKRSEKFIIRHVGIVNDKCDPRPFMEAVEALCKREPAMREVIQIDFLGQVNEAFQAYVKQNPLLHSITSFSPPVSHKQVIRLYEQSAVLLLILTGYKDAEGYMPGKLFEYSATGLPIVGVGPLEGDAANFFKESNTGTMIASENSTGIQELLTLHFRNWQTAMSSGNQASMAYSRKAMTEKLAQLL